MSHPAKKHKRSPSVTGSPAASHAPMRSMKKYMGPRSYGKFQKRSKNEKKNFDTDIVAAGMSTIPSLATAATYCLNLFTAGTSANNVLGRQAVMRSLLLRMSIRQAGNVSTGATATSVRVLVLYDRQPSGAAAATSATILGATTYGTASPLNLGTSDRFSVLLDEKLTLGGIGVQGTVTNQCVELPAPQYVDRYVKIGLPSEANTNFTGGIGGIQTGAVLILAWSDIAAANNPPVVDCAMSRIRFTDN